MEERTLTKHYFISGRVQGVGFRAFTRRLAEEMKLRGWVRNLQDGRVEALVSGPAATLAQFEIRLRQGPTHGEVQGWEAREEQSLALPEMFEIRKDSYE